MKEFSVSPRFLISLLGVALFVPTCTTPPRPRMGMSRPGVSKPEPQVSSPRSEIDLPKPEAGPERKPGPQMLLPRVGATRVLFLGDSLSVGEFGGTFDRQLRQAGFEVYTSVAGGGTPYYWLEEYPPISIDITYWERTPTSQRRLPGISPVPKIEGLLAKWKPDIVIVQTGTNLYAPLRSKKRTKSANVREIESLVEKMCRVITANGKRRCYWITPPDAHTKRYPQALQNEMLSIMQRVAGKYGPVFNSYEVTSYTEPYPKNDGIHLERRVARSWGEKAARDFISRHRTSR